MENVDVLAENAIAKLSTWLRDDELRAYCRAARKGVPLDLADLTPNAQDAIGLFAHDVTGHLRGIHQQMPNINLKIGFTSNHTFNASAALRSDTGIICFNFGVVPIVFNVFGGMMYNAEAFPQIHGKPPLKFRIPRDESILAFFYDQGDIQEPPYLPPERAMTANLLAMASLNFLFFHEFAHIRNGHVDLLSSLNAVDLGEFGQPRIRNITPLDRRTMEWDADRVAYILNTEIWVTRLLGGPYLNYEPPKRKEKFLLLHSAYYILFRLLDAAEGNGLCYDDRFHPLAGDRYLLLLNKAKGMAHTLGFEVTETELVDAMKIGDVAWLSLFFDEDAAGALRCSMDFSMDALSNWSLLRPRLVPFNRGTTDLADPLIF